MAESVRYQCNDCQNRFEIPVLTDQERREAERERRPIYPIRCPKCIVLSFVQFKDVELDQLPRVYLATPSEVAQRLKETANRRGDIVLYEGHAWGSRAHGAGTSEFIPEYWKFSVARLVQLLESDSA